MFCANTDRSAERDETDTQRRVCTTAQTSSHKTVPVFHIAVIFNPISSFLAAFRLSPSMAHPVKRSSHAETPLFRRS